MRRIVILIATLTMLLLLVAPAAAKPPSIVEFVVPTVISDPGESPFTATGLPGGECPKGTTYQLVGVPLDRRGPFAHWEFLKQFVCEDPDHSFTLLLTAWFGSDEYPLPMVFGYWTVVDGTGAYENLRGSGRLRGYYECGPGCVVDTYTGRLHM